MRYNRFYVIAVLAMTLVACTPNVKTRQLAKVLKEVSEQVDRNESQAKANAAPADSTYMDGSMVPAAVKGDQLLQRLGYISCYNPATHQPDWVYWQLTPARLEGDASRQGVGFAEDDEVAEPRVTTYDYMRSGYDRGHQCPAADNRWSQEAMNQSFLLTNICPQSPKLNKYEWNRLESQCRDWANEYGSVYIVCGPLFSVSSHKRIGQSVKIPVPSAFFKVILVLGDSPKAIGFVYQNIDDKQDYRKCVTTVDAIEQATGYDFFPGLKDDIEKRVEASADIDQWSQDRLDSGSK